MMLESNVWGENSFLFIHTTWIGNDLLKIRKMNSAELILKTANSSAIALAAILKTRSARRLARCLLPAFLCAHIFIKRETSGYEAATDLLVCSILLRRNLDGKKTPASKVKDPPFIPQFRNKQQENDLRMCWLRFRLNVTVLTNFF